MKRLLAVSAVLGSYLALGPDPAAAELPVGHATVVTQDDLVEPTSLAFAPDGRLFVAEKRGTIQTYDSVDDETPSLFADLRTQVHNAFDRGLLSIEVDPDWPVRPYVYAFYSYDAPVGQVAPVYGAPAQDSDPCPTGGTLVNPVECPAQSRVARLTSDDGPSMTSLDLLVSEVCREFQFHDGGGLRMGPDDQLYASFGDGAWPSGDRGAYGSPGDPCGDPPGEGGSLRSQDARTPDDPTGLSGSLVRIDPDGATGPETLAYGLRNPFRMAVDRGGDVWVGDVGASLIEELDVVRQNDPVTNFGWPCHEGSAANQQFADHPICVDLIASDDAVGPADYYCHAGSKPDCASGPGAISGLSFGATGDLFFADYTRESIFVRRAQLGGGLGPIETFGTELGGPVDLRHGPGDDLFYADIYNGRIVRVYEGVSTVPPPEAPKPTAHIDSPTTGTQAYIGRALQFAGSATSETGSPLPPSALRWTFVVQHCTGEDSCHRHFTDSRAGVSSGSFTVPVHDGDWRVEVVLRATGATSSDQTSVLLSSPPKTK